ncbi:MAG: hypothetical protein CVV28_02190 [Methanobacteriales archaeon HGW-Methanobacteriales-1]|jgi:hypothetical protein|nr:MAG: hypothetical protein CVV28_02190 [Methanobacteriales archaeon HGW-Methanobacteriales-1]
MTLEFRFEVPKHNELKQGKVFDLEAFATTNYQLVLLSNIAGLSINSLDKFDSSMQAYEVNPANYERANVPLQLTESVNGYQVNVVGGIVSVPISDATIAGALIIKQDTGDILAGCLSVVPTGGSSELHLTTEIAIQFRAALWEKGEQICTASV